MALTEVSYFPYSASSGLHGIMIQRQKIKEMRVTGSPGGYCFWKDGPSRIVRNSIGASNSSLTRRDLQKKKKNSTVFFFSSSKYLTYSTLFLKTVKLDF